MNTNYATFLYYKYDRQRTFYRLSDEPKDSTISMVTEINFGKAK